MAGVIAQPARDLYGGRAPDRTEVHELAVGANTKSDFCGRRRELRESDDKRRSTYKSRNRRAAFASSWSLLVRGPESARHAEPSLPRRCGPSTSAHENPAPHCPQPRG